MRVTEVEAKIELFRKDQGGRQKPPSWGYQPSFCVSDVQLACVIRPVGEPSTGFIPIGKAVNVNLTIARPELLERDVTPGLSFELREASWVVGRGVVSAILSQEE